MRASICSRLPVLTGLVLLACSLQLDETFEQASPHARPRSAASPPSEPTASTDTEPDFYSPYMELAKIPGPTPIFEVLDDAEGRRYASGEGAFVEVEGGEVQALPAVAMLTPTLADADELVDPDAIEAPEFEPPPKVRPKLGALLATTEPAALLPVAIALVDGEQGLQA